MGFVEKQFNIIKQGFEFNFRNPTLENSNELVLEYKIKGVREFYENDGFYFNAKFLEDKKAISFLPLNLNNKLVNGVLLPDDVFNELKNIKQDLINKKIIEENNLINNLINGNELLTVKLIKHPYPKYQILFDNFDLKTLEKAIRTITDKYIFLINPIEFIEEKINNLKAKEDFKVKLVDLIDFKILEEKKKIKDERAKIKSSMNVEVLNKYNDQGGIYAKVKVTDNKTLETKIFKCSNICDYGFVVSPISKENLTSFDERAIKYLEEFPPIHNDIIL